MINTNELKAAFARKGLTQKQVAEKIGISAKAMSCKMRKGVFLSNEIEQMILMLDLDDPAGIFFAKAVS